MNFYIDNAESLAITDAEILELLMKVYVEGGFTDLEKATALFEPSVVRKRGVLVCAREKQKKILAGMVIMVPSDSPARVFAQENESEMHLLGVNPEFRGKGLGSLLVSKAIKEAEKNGYLKMLLWTQPTMYAAQRLYESLGFTRVPKRDFNRGNRDFLFYEKILNR